MTGSGAGGKGWKTGAGRATRTVCMAVGREPEEAASLAVRAVSMTGTGIVLPVVARAAAVYRVLQPWSRTRAVAELGGCLADITVTETEG